MKKAVLCILMVFVFSSTALAQRLPVTNTDLQSVEDYAGKVIIESQACTGNCVELSCAAAADVYTELKKLEKILILLGALESGPGKDYTVALADWQYEMLESEYKPTLEQELRTSEALAVQDYLLATADNLLNVANIADWGNSIAEGEYDYKKIELVLKYFNDAYASFGAAEELYAAASYEEKKELPPELKRFDDIKGTVQGIQLDLNGMLLEGKFTTSNVGVLVADIAKIYAQKDRMERAQRLAADRRARLMAGNKWQLAYTSLYEAQRRKERIKETYARVEDAIRALDDSCLRQYCKGTLPDFATVPDPVTTQPEPLPSAESVAKVQYWGDQVSHYNNELLSSSNALSAKIQGLTVTRPCFGDERCAVFPLYDQRRDIAYDSTGTVKWVATAQLRALNERLAPFDDQEGIILAPDTENLQTFLDARGGYIPGCPFLGIGLTVRGGTLQHTLNQIKTHGTKHSLYPLKDQVQKDHELITQTYDWLGTIRNEAGAQVDYDEEQYFATLRQTIDGLEAERLKWQQELDFLEAHLPADDVYLNRAQDTIAGILEDIDQRIDQMKDPLMWYEIRNDPAFVAAVDEGVRLREQAGAAEGAAEREQWRYENKKTSLSRAEINTLFEKAKALRALYDQYEEDMGSFAAQQVVNYWPDIPYEELRNRYDGHRIATRGMGYVTVTFPSAEPLLPEIPDCEDTDAATVMEGRSLEVRGEIIVDGKVAYQDSCLGAQVKEGSCSVSGTLEVVLHDCPTGMACDGGICVNISADQPQPPTNDTGVLVTEKPEEELPPFDFPSEHSSEVTNYDTGEKYGYHPERMAHLPVIQGNFHLGETIDHERAPEPLLNDADRDGLRMATAAPGAENTWLVAVTARAAGTYHLNIFADADQSGGYEISDWAVKNRAITFSSPGTQLINVSFTLPAIPRQQEGIMARLTLTSEAADTEVDSWDARAFPSNTAYAPNYIVRGGESESYLVPVAAVQPQSMGEVIGDVAAHGPLASINTLIPEEAKDLLGTNEINLYIKDRGKTTTYRLRVVDGVLTHASRGRVLDPEPTMKIEVDQELVDALFVTSDPLGVLRRALDAGRIKIEQKGLFSSFISKLALTGVKLGVKPASAILAPVRVRDSSLHTSTQWPYCPGDCHALFRADEEQSLSYHISADPSQVKRLTFRMRAALDDIYTLRLPYSIDVSLNGQPVADDVPLGGLVHGRPYGKQFTNFAEWEFVFPQQALQHLRQGENKIMLSDLKGARGTQGDWIVLEWSELEAHVETTAQATDCAQPPSGLVSWWTGDANARDYEDGNHGSLANGVSFTTGRVEQAFSLDGSDDYVSAGTGRNLIMSDAMTMSAWIHPSGDGIIVNKEGEYEVARFGDGTIQWAFANSDPGWNWIDTGFVAPADRWTHVAVVYDSGEVTTYANGKLVHTYTGAGSIGDISPDMDELQIGARQDPNFPFFFAGRIDEVELYGRALSAQEIGTLVSSTRCT